MQLLRIFYKAYGKQGENKMENLEGNYLLSKESFISLYIVAEIAVLQYHQKHRCYLIYTTL